MIKAALIATPLENDKRRILSSAEDFRKEISSHIDDELVFVNADEILDEPCKFIFVASGGSAQAFKAIYEKTHGPYVLITTPGNNSLAASMEELSYVNDHGQVFRTISRLDGYRVGVLGSPNMLINSEYDVDKLRKSAGIETVYITMDEVCAEIEKRTYEPDTYTQALIETGYDRNELEKAFHIYGAVRRLIDRHHFDAVSLRCFDLLDPYKASGCLALAILNSMGIPASCEGDTRSLLSMVVMSTLTGQPCFMANPSRIDMDRKEIVLAHCTLPLSMVDSYSLTTHFESGISVAVKGEFADDTYTLFKCREDMRTYFVQKAAFVENLNECDLCRTQVRLRVEDVDSYLTHPLSNHQIMVRGDHVDEVNELFKWYSVRN